MILRTTLILIPFLFISNLGQAGAGRDYSYYEQKVEACSNVDSSPERCYWWQVHKNSKCGVGKSCDNLVIYFSGGDQGCAIAGQVGLNVIYGELARKFADEGFVFVCANLFENLASPWAGALPYSDESDRVAELVSDITKNKNLRKHWNGNRLLFSGISHGATAPVLAMKYLQSGTLAQGKKVTGACFMDGQYDAVYNQAFWKGAGEECDWFYNRTICNRYFGEEECGYPKMSEEILADSIVRTNQIRQPTQASDFGVKHWKLVSCGSFLKRRCSLEPGGTTGSVWGDLLAHRADMFPAQPIQKLCKIIDEGPQHSCQYQPLPFRTHVDCGLTGVPDVQCIPWFKSIR